MIVNCVAYDRGQKLSDIPLTDVRSHLAKRDCFVWVALKDPEPDELALLQEARNAVLTAARDEATETGAALRDVVNRVNADDFDKLVGHLLAKRSDLRALFDEEHGLERAESLLRARLSLDPALTREAAACATAAAAAARGVFAEEIAATRHLYGHPEPRRRVS